jgi:hypothetical protein
VDLVGDEQGALRSRGKRRRLAVIAAMATVAVAWIGLSIRPALDARDSLTEGRDRLAEASSRLLSGDASGALHAFQLAHRAFEEAAGHASSPVLRMDGLVPLAGRTADATRDLASIGELTASAGERIASALADLPGGVSSLAPVGGRLPLDALNALAGPVGAATDELRRASELAGRLPTSLVLGPVARAARDVRMRLDAAVHTATAVDALTRALPSFAGQDETKRYFLAVQNPAELRGTGGFIGVYSILSMERGAFRLSPFQDIATLPDVPAAEMPIPAPGFAAIYNRFGGGGFWRNINMTPDAPTAASAMEQLYARVRGVSPNGVVFVDPQALAFILEATGPVTVPELNRTISAVNAVPFLTNRAYFLYESPAKRKRVLGLAATWIFERFLSNTDGVAAIRALVTSAAGGHLILHATDPVLESAFEQAGVAGRLGGSTGDYHGLFLNNASGTKVDYYLHASVDYAATLHADGSSAASVTLHLINDAPAEGRANEVLGPYPSTNLALGEDRSLVFLYCGARCALVGTSRDGGSGSIAPFEELGLHLFMSSVRILAQDSTTLGYRFRTAGAWAGGEDGGSYCLTIQGQPTINPTKAEVTVTAPPGMNIIDTNPAARLSGGSAIWTKPLGGSRRLCMWFSPPFLARVWADVKGFLTKPVIKLSP